MSAAVSHIFRDGFRLLLIDKQYFLSFEDFPCFKNSAVSAIQNVELLSEHYLYWPDLDVDLAVESIEHPEQFPLVAKT